MATKNPNEIHHTAVSLGRAYSALQTAFIELAQLDENMPEELAEYLYDEKYDGVSYKALIHTCAALLAGMQSPMQELSLDVTNLSADLSRVGRGESFSV